MSTVPVSTTALPQEAASDTSFESSTMSSTVAGTPPPTDAPLAVILASAIVGGIALLVLIIASLILLCFINRRDKQETKKSTNSRAENGQANESRSETGSRPLYAQLFRSSTVRSSSKRQKKRKESTVQITEVQPPKPPPESPPVTNCNPPRPSEISAFGMDVPRTFRPFAPPPKNTASLRRNENTQIQNRPREGHYDFLESVDGEENGLTQSLQIPLSSGNNPRMKPNREQAQPRYYRVPPQTSLSQEDSFTSSLNVHPLLESLRSEYADSDYQYPRPTTLPRRGKYEDDTQIYSECLNPTMFDRRNGLVRRESKVLPYPPIYDRPKPVIPSDQPTEVTRRNIVELQDLGMGRFGRVVLAATSGLSLKDLKLGENDDKCRSLLVAIKKLREDADKSLSEAFQNEIKFMAKLKHANVARLLGVCVTGESFLMMEYMEKGDLHEFLQKQTLVLDTVDALKDNELTPLVLLYMGVQIASGMRYLAKRKFVHRDLATRNCLVGQDFIIKISDFGMSRNLYESSYYLVQGKLILPIRWMAYESFYGKFSPTTDAWSFGITLWEIYTLAKFDPYHEMSDEEFIADTMKGAKRKILDQPRSCPNEVFDVMARCWIHEPNMRADFEEIYSRLFLIYTKLSKQY